MMRNRIVLLILLFAFGVNACQQEDKVTTMVTRHYQKRNMTFDKELEHCIILPEVGCEGCIASGVNFFLNNEKYFSNTQKKNMIVFTAVNSKKMLFRTLGITSLENYYCYLDLKNDYLVGGNQSIYPLVLHLKDGVIVKAEYQSPYSENIMGQLEMELTK